MDTTPIEIFSCYCHAEPGDEHEPGAVVDATAVDPDAPPPPTHTLHTHTDAFAGRYINGH